jgi:DNA-binding protein HU-beta
VVLGFHWLCEAQLDLWRDRESIATDDIDRRVVPLEQCLLLSGSANLLEELAVHSRQSVGKHRVERDHQIDGVDGRPGDTTRQLAYALAEQHQLTKRQGVEVVENLVGLIIKHLKGGERVKIAGLGILQVRERAARMGRNPKTGEPIQIEASKKVAFRASKDLKTAI